MKRKIAIALMISAIVVLIAEFLGLYFARQSHQRAVADETKSQLAVDLGTLSAALQSGNQALYEKSYRNFSSHLATYRTNPFARRESAEQITKLSEYAQLLSDDAETVRTLNSFHATLLQLNLTPETDDNIEKLSDYRKKFTQLASNIEQTAELPLLAELRERSLKILPKLASKLDAVLVCAGLCPTATMNEKQKDFSESLAEGIKQLKIENADIAERYSPAEYILLLQ